MEKEPWAGTPVIGLLLGIFSSMLLLNALLSQYHYLLQIPHVSLHLTKTKMTPPPTPTAPVPVCPPSLAPHNPSQGQLPFVQWNHQSHGPLCLPPFLRSCSWKLLVQPDDNLSIFSRKKVVARICPTQFVLRLQCSDLTGSLLKGTLALTVSEPRRLPASHRALHPLTPGSKNPVAPPWRAEALHAQH